MSKQDDQEVRLLTQNTKGDSERSGVVRDELLLKLSGELL
jgi:hypothetical protein